MNMLSTSMRTALVLGIAASSAAAQSLWVNQGTEILGQTNITQFNITYPAVGTVTADRMESDWIMDENGNVAFAMSDTTVTAPDIRQRTIFYGHDASDLIQVATTHSAAPGFPGALLGTNNSSFGYSGLVAESHLSPQGGFMLFNSNCYDDPAAVPPLGLPSGYNVLFRGIPGATMQPFLKDAQDLTGQGFPGEFLNMNTNDFGAQTAFIHSNGDVVLTAGLDLALGTATSFDDDLILHYRNSTGNWSTFLREGQDSSVHTWMHPGEYTRANSFEWPSNANGQIVCSMQLSNTPGAFFDDSVLISWDHNTGNTTLLAREGSQAAGMAPGIVYDASASNMRGFGDSGVFGFVTNVTDYAALGIIENSALPNCNDQVLYRGNVNAPGGGITKVLQSNDLIPGNLAGDRIGVINTSSLECNANGAMVFGASISDNLGTPSVSSGIFYVKTDNTIVEVARVGDVLNLPGGPYTVTSVNHTGSNTAINNNNMVVCRLTVTSGAGNDFLSVLWSEKTGYQMMVSNSECLAIPGGFGGWVHPQTGHVTNGGRCFKDSGLTLYRSSNGIFRVNGGMMEAYPLVIDSIAGGTQNWKVHAGTGHAGDLYAIAGSASGTAPGFPAFGGHIPLNPDAYFNLTTGLLSTTPGGVMSHTLGFLDANGEAPSLSAPVYPSAVCGINIPALTTLAPGDYDHVTIILDAATLTIKATTETEPLFLK